MDLLAMTHQELLQLVPRHWQKGRKPGIILTSMYASTIPVLMIA
jgi:hypothetical protein